MPPPTAPDRAPYQVPLTRAGHAWRLVVCLLISTLAWWEIVGAQLEEEPILFAIDLALGVASYVLVMYRRQAPFAIAMTLSVVGLLSASSAGPATLAFVSLATQRQVPRIVATSIVSITTGQLFYYYQPHTADDPPWLNFAFLVLLTAALAAFGMYLGSRRELLWTLEERARQAEAEAELRTERARLGERERIAREMHDVLAHRISLVAMHSGALAFREDLTPEQVRESAALIQAKAHEALTDLRQVLGMLREEEMANRPQPTLADLPDLVAEAEATGLRVAFDDAVDGEPGEQVGRTVYRVVQEGLTNARKHGGGDHVRVDVAGDEADGLRVVVRNGKRFGAFAATPVSGLGLVGLRERAELIGGRLEVDESADSFTLRCWLPWRP